MYFLKLGRTIDLISMCQPLMSLEHTSAQKLNSWVLQGNSHDSPVKLMGLTVNQRVALKWFWTPFLCTVGCAIIVGECGSHKLDRVANLGCNEGFGFCSWNQFARASRWMNSVYLFKNPRIGVRTLDLQRLSLPGLGCDCCCCSPLSLRGATES